MTEAPRSVLVTGATGGLGAQVCRLAAAAGWQVWLGCRDLEAGRRLADGLGGAAAPVLLDLADAAGIAAALDTIASAPPAAVVLNAAPAPVLAPFGRTDMAALRGQLDVGVLGNLALIGGLWSRCFRKAGFGHVIGVSSKVAAEPVPQMAAYGIVKVAFEGLLRAALADYGPAGLRVSLLRPGYMETPMLAGMGERLAEILREKGQVGAPEAVAARIVAALAAPPEAGQCRIVDCQETRP